LTSEAAAVVDQNALPQVETYFSSLTDYWIGLRRTASNKPYVFTNGGQFVWCAMQLQLVAAMVASDREMLPAGDSVTQVVSNVDDYAHWSWMHPGNSSANSTNSCVYASNQYQYDFFNGDNQNVSQTNTSSFFQTISADLKNGWTATACSAQYTYVCMMPSSVFPCGPPPSPPPPPPSPPVPPSPPLPASCGQPTEAGALTLPPLAVPGGLLHQQLAAVRAAGAPLANRTYFCDPGDNNCYSLVSTKLPYVNASNFCEGMSGQLVAYSSREKQLLVERYFK
jgi:hypothetical protein